MMASALFQIQNGGLFLGNLMNEDIDSVGGKNITAMTLWSWQRVFDAKMNKVVDPRAMPAIDQLVQECIEGPFDLRRRQLTEQPLEQYFLNTKHPSEVEPWHTLLRELARCVAARDSGLPRARHRRRHHSPQGDAGLRGQFMQRWKQGAAGVDAEHRSLKGSSGQYPGSA
jgi:hypothetical protein